jgi:hypothetical protein
MIGRIKVLGYRINFVFRHRFEKKNKNSWFENRYYWKQYRLGFSFQRNLIISKPKDGPAVIGKNSTRTYGYMFCVELILCKFWIDICRRPLEFSI